MQSLWLFFSDEKPVISDGSPWWICLCRQVKLVVAKCWDASPHGYFLPPRGDEPVRPIDPSAWVAHTEAVRQEEGFAGAGPASGFVPASFGLMPAFGQTSSLDSSPLSSFVTGLDSCMIINLL